MKPRPRILKLLTGALLLLGSCHVANAQAGQLQDPAALTLPLDVNRSGNIQVYVRTEDGEPLSTSPKVTILAPSDTAAIPQMKKSGEDIWIFSGAEIGDTYEVQVQAAGYRTEFRPIRLLDTADGSASIIVFMRSPDDELAFHPPSGQFVLAPRAEKEAQKGSTDLDSGKIESAQKHLSNALKMAPDNPYVNYLMGMRFLLNGDLPAAKPYLEKSVSSDARPLPLKGRAWVSENGGQVMHMETDLIHTMPEIKLQREHSVIDYTMVTFSKHKVTLWLPENVDVYFQYRGHYLHHYHHFSNFKLFWTGSTQKIGQPKESKDKHKDKSD